MVTYKHIVIHFGEIWLKGRNRGTFVRKLYQNIELALKEEKYSSLDNLRDRFLLVLDKKSNIDSIKTKLSKVFGISWFAPVVVTNSTLADILKETNKLLGVKDTVRIVPHRASKELSFNSSEIVSYFIKNSIKLNFKIDKTSKKDFYINVTKDRTFLFTEKINGAKGLPVGSSGSAVLLLSGGIDSPVAAFYAMKRGILPMYLHVHAFQNNKDEKLSKINELGKQLAQYSNDSKIFYAPGHLFQSAALKIPRKYELVLFKLFLYKLAEKIVAKEEADCIVSGESLGQVASQTISNLATSEQGIKSFIMRPLIGFDKQEIINIAKSIGTFETSIKSYRDVCSISARNPATGSDYKIIQRLWKKASMNSVLLMTLKKTSYVEISS